MYTAADFWPSVRRSPKSEAYGDSGELCVQRIHSSTRLPESNFYQHSKLVNSWRAIFRGLLSNQCVNKVTSIVTPSSSHDGRHHEGVSVRDTSTAEQQSHRSDSCRNMMQHFEVKRASEGKREKW